MFPDLTFNFAFTNCPDYVRQVVEVATSSACPCFNTVYPKKYAHGFVVLCFVVVMQSFIMNSHEVFIHIHQGCFAGTGAIVRLPQCQWSKPDGYGKISQCITTTKHSKAKTVCIFLGIYCSSGALGLVPVKTKNGYWSCDYVNLHSSYLSNKCWYTRVIHCNVVNQCDLKLHILFKSSVYSFWCKDSLIMPQNITIKVTKSSRLNICGIILECT